MESGKIRVANSNKTFLSLLDTSHYYKLLSNPNGNLIEINRLYMETINTIVTPL